MFGKITCPQCRASLTLLKAPTPGKTVTCPGCQLKFVPSVISPADPAPGPRRSRLALVLVTLILGAGGGIAVREWLLHRDSPPSPVVDKQPGLETNPETAGNPQAKLETKPHDDPKSKSALEPAPKSAAPTPPAPVGPNEELPDQPRPIVKKPSPKIYAESKRPLLNEPPAPVIVANPVALAGADNPRQQKINEAIEKGVAFLKKTQGPNGVWSSNFNNVSYPVGYAALGGLTLLECQVPANDPAVQKAAAFVRSTPVTDHRTYQTSLAILFLDRLGDPRDKGLIQGYALNLIGNQTFKGGWPYDGQSFSTHELTQLLNFLEATRLPVPEVRDPFDTTSPDPFQSPRTSDLAEPEKEATAQEKRGDADREAKPPKDGKAVRPKPPVPALKNLAATVAAIPTVYHYYSPKPVPVNHPGIVMGLGDDNSNSQFALLALWAARRHGVPSERCLILAAQRYTATQNADGGWSYLPHGPGNDSTPAMTCVGLLGLAMGHAVVPKAPGKNGKPVDDATIQKGLSKLGQHVDRNSMNNFYFLWSMERVGMLYRLKTIGNQDWYGLGVDMLLPSQQSDGSWTNGNYTGSTPALDTCFALLFLKRSNLVQDLSDRLPFLMSISDPAGQPSRR
jgi:hypothetical protein